MADYLNCDSDTANNVDFFGCKSLQIGVKSLSSCLRHVCLVCWFEADQPANKLRPDNIYSWCDPSTYQASGYAERTTFFQDYSVPVFFAEYGCNKNEPRQFQEVSALFSEPMTSVWSGGIVYQYFQETNNYGLVNVQDNSKSHIPGRVSLQLSMRQVPRVYWSFRIRLTNMLRPGVTPRQDFDNLSSQMAKISPTGTSYAAVSTNMSPASCPAVDATWLSTPTPLPIRPNQDLCDCVTPLFSCVVNDDTDEDDYGDLFSKLRYESSEY